MAQRKSNSNEVSLSIRWLWLLLCAITGGAGYYLGTESATTQQQNLEVRIQALNDKIATQDALIEEQQGRLEQYDKVRDVVTSGIEKVFTKKKNRE